MRLTTENAGLVGSVTGRNQKWLLVVTELPTAEGPLHLAIALDAFSGRQLGWCYSSEPDPDNAVQALDCAKLNRDGRVPACIVALFDQRVAGCSGELNLSSGQPEFVGTRTCMGKQAGGPDKRDIALAREVTDTLRLVMPLDGICGSRREAVDRIDAWRGFFNRAYRREALFHITPVDFENLGN